MKIKGNRFVTSILAASMLSGTFFVPASAGELEGESAIAGMAVTLNNYYAGEETPDEAILDYLVPKAQATSEAESETETEEPKTEEPKTVMAATVAVTSDASNVGLVSAAGYLNVREQPSTGSVTVGRLFSNCQVNIKSSVNNSEGSWYRITCGDVEGYVSAAYVLVGTAAKTAEDNIQNRYAVVTADQLNVRDSASDSANVVGTVYKDEEYAIIEDQGDFVKIHIANDEVGYVSKSGITIKTQFAQAQKVDNEFVSQELENFMIDINYSRNVYEQAMAEGTGEGYYRAYAAIVYAAELLGYYSEFAADSGLEDLAATSKQEQESALALADAAYKLASDSGYFTQVAESVASSEAAAESSAAAESVQETQTQPSTDASSEGNTTSNTAETTAPSSSASDETISVEVPTAASVTGIEACYQGGTKYVGDVVYTAELFVRVSYSDGTVKDIYDGWYSPQVGMTLKQEGYNVVTMYYGDFSSNLEVYANPAPTQATQPAAPETQHAAPETQPAAPETQPAAPETQPAAPETQPTVPETQPSQPTGSIRVTNVALSSDLTQYTLNLCSQYGVDSSVIFSVMYHESHFNAGATSGKGAQGLMQIIPRYSASRMAKLGVTNLYDPASNILVGIDLLAEYYHTYGSWNQALTAYRTGNAGNDSAYAATILGSVGMFQTVYYE